MRNKILKAINEAVLNALSTDITDQDIDFNHSDIDTNGLTIAYSLNDIQKCLGIDLKMCDSSNILTLILNDNTEISLHQFTNQTVKYIRIHANKETNMHEIILSINDISFKCTWLTSANMCTRISNNFIDDDCINCNSKFNEIPSSKKLLLADFDGVRHTYNNIDIIYNDRNIKRYPALDYCREYCKNDANYYSYMPAYGEIAFLYKWNGLISEIQKYVNAQYPLYLEKYAWWTSTEKDSLCAYTINTGEPAYEIKYNDHNYNYNYTIRKDVRVLPLFKKRLA